VKTRDQHERQTLTVEEAADVLGIGRTLAYEAVRRGEIPTVRLGRRLLVPRGALDHLLTPFLLPSTHLQLGTSVGQIQPRVDRSEARSTTTNGSGAA
jgi:excisionase family DNA binding protein